MLARIRNRNRSVSSDRSSADQTRVAVLSSSVPESNGISPAEGEAVTPSQYKPISVSHAILDYWNEWVGVLMCVKSGSSDIDITTLTAKALITGGSLVRPFDQRFHRAHLTEDRDPADIERIKSLNNIASEANTLWSSGKFTAESISALSDKAHQVIYSSPQKTFR